MFNIIPSGPEEITSHRWPVLDWIRFLYNNEVYHSGMENPHDLELIIRGDGFPVAANRHACFLMGTFGNFGPLSQCLAFNFPLVLAEVNEKSRNKVRQAFSETLKELNELQKIGFVRINAHLVVKVRVEWGGDESWMRMMLGLKSCKEALGCYNCYWHRASEYAEAFRVDRVLAFFHLFFVRGTVDNPDPPNIWEGRIRQCHHCGMHAFIPFGKDLIQYSFLWLRVLEAAGTPRYKQAEVWLKQHHINVDISYPFQHLLLLTDLNYSTWSNEKKLILMICRKEPLHGKWNLKATHTWELTLNWESWCEAIALDVPKVNQLVAELLECFEVVYTFSFETVYHKFILERFEKVAFLLLFPMCFWVLTSSYPECPGLCCSLEGKHFVWEAPKLLSLAGIRSSS